MPVKKDHEKENPMWKAYADDQYKKLLNEIDQYIPQDDFCSRGFAAVSRKDLLRRPLCSPDEL